LNPKIKSHFLENKINIACGGATKRGFNYALKIKSKCHTADDQMDLPYIPNTKSIIGGALHKEIVLGT
jgi:hypothetical protein